MGLAATTSAASSDATNPVVSTASSWGPGTHRQFHQELLRARVWDPDHPGGI